MKELRLALFFDCNRRCPYCCNKIPKVRATLKPLPDMMDLENYEVIKITGGEPMLHPEKIKEVIDWARIGTTIYVYTNGHRMEEWALLEDWGVTGINWTPHDGPTKADIRLAGLMEVPVTVRLREDLVTPELKKSIKDAGLGLNIWKPTTNCPTVEEDRFYLTD